MTSPFRRVASAFLPVQGSAPQGRVSKGPATPSAFAGPTAPNPNAPPPARRTVLGRMGTFLLLAAAVRPAAALSPTPDAGLIRLCNAFHAANNASHAADDASWERHLARRWEISDAIEDMTPATEAGHWAKAGVALVLMEELADFENAPERFALVTLRDLVDGGVA